MAILISIHDNKVPDLFLDRCKDFGHPQVHTSRGELLLVHECKDTFQISGGGERTIAARQRSTTISYLVWGLVDPISKFLKTKMCPCRIAIPDDAGRVLWLCAIFLGACARCLAFISAESVQGEFEPIRFADETSASGLMFEHYTDSKGRFMLPEITGSGGAALDYDRDGDMDLYLVQGSFLSGQLLDPNQIIPRDRLFRNDLKEGKVHWTDVSNEAGISQASYGMGAATGDFNNDGWVDLYVTNIGRNFLLKNLGNGRFQEVAIPLGVADPGWGTSAVFFDYDRDGWLDLFVANYVLFSVEWERRCYATNSALDFCGPSAYQPAQDRLFRNLGNGSFEDVTIKMGITGSHAPGLGVVVGDWDQNDLLDIYVANDGARNQLWQSQGEGQSFKDVALLHGAAVNGIGAPEAGMGVDSGDFDNDSDEDLFLAHLMTESNTLYVNDGKSLFDDRTTSFNLHTASLNRTGFGVGWVDFDNDGWLDIFIANGGVKTMGKLVTPQYNPMAQENLFFRNLRGKRFTPVEEPVLGQNQSHQSSRGAVFADFDNDGDTDIVVNNNGGTARFLANQTDSSQHWIGLHLDHPDSLPVHHSRITVTSLGGPSKPIVRWMRTEGSYCSARDPRVLVGLDGDASDCRVEIRWPDGHLESWDRLTPDRYWKLERGKSSIQ
jgi:hypothetical protein